jgi:hypothetical protein
MSDGNDNRGQPKAKKPDDKTVLAAMRSRPKATCGGSSEFAECFGEISP